MLRCCAAEVVLIGYDSRSLSAQLTNQLAGVSDKAVLISGQQSSVRHPVGVLFGFVVGFSASPPPVTSVVRLQLWRRLQENNYQLVCQRQVPLPANNASHVAREVITHTAHATPVIIIVVVICFAQNSKRKTENTRKRVIAKALQLEGDPDFAPVDLAYYQHFLGFFCSKILRFGKFRPATTNADHVAPRPFSTSSNKFAQISQSICVACYIRCDLDLCPLTLNHVLAVTW